MQRGEPDSQGCDNQYTGTRKEGQSWAWGRTLRRWSPGDEWGGSREGEGGQWTWPAQGADHVSSGMVCICSLRCDTGDKACGCLILHVRRETTIIEMGAAESGSAIDGRSVVISTVADLVFSERNSRREGRESETNDAKKSSVA